MDDLAKKDDVTITIRKQNVSLFLSAIELKLKVLTKIQKQLLKEKQMKSANELITDMMILERAIKKLTPMKPVTLPFTPKQNG